MNFTRNMMGQIIRRDEKDNQITNTSPYEVWYRYAGVELGYVGNNPPSLKLRRA